MPKTDHLHTQSRHLGSSHRPARTISWLTALKAVFKQAVLIDRSQLSIARTIRSAVGFLLPLVIGLATNHLLIGVAVAGGAASLGSTGLSFTYPARTRTMLLASLGLIISALIGGLVGHIWWLVVLAIALWGFGGGFIICLGQPAMIIGLQATIAMIVFAHVPLTPLQTLYQAGLVGAGALLQTLLAIIPFTHQRADVEHAALSSIYQALSKYAKDADKPQSGAAVNEALVQAENTLDQLPPHYQKRRFYSKLMEEGEYIRLELIILSNILQSFDKDDPTSARLAEQLHGVLDTIAALLHDIAHTLTYQHGVSSHLSKSISHLEEEISEFKRNDFSIYVDTAIEQAQIYCDLLYKRLSDVAEIVSDVQAATERIEQQFASLLPAQKRLELKTPLQTLRENFTFSSMYFRHALRMALTLAIAVAIYQLFPQIVQHGYWIPLTIVLVLKPEFSETFSRGLARSLGTILGIVLTTLLVTLLKPDVYVLLGLDVLVAFLAFSLQNVNYALFSCFITAEVVLLLAFVDPQPVQITLVRFVDTVIGGVLAMLAYMLWPSWARLEAPKQLAKRLETLRVYFVTVLNAFIQPSKEDTEKIRRVRHAAQSARFSAEASVRRSQQEPEHMQVNQKISRGLLTTTDDLARAILGLEGYLLDRPTQNALPVISPFLKEIDAILRTQVMILQDDTVGAPPPKLRELLKVLEHVRDERSENYEQVAQDLNFIIIQARVIIESVNKISDLLATKYHTTTDRLPAVNPLLSVDSAPYKSIEKSSH